MRNAFASMKRLLLALALALLIEAILGLLFLQFGKGGLGRTGESNMLGSVILALHGPGYVLAKWLAIPKQYGLLFIGCIAVCQWVAAIIACTLLRQTKK